MSENELSGRVAVLAPAIGLAVLVWFLWSRKRVILLSLNVLVSVSLLIIQAPHLRYTFTPPFDEQVIALIIFELLVLTTTLWACRGGRLLLVASPVAFSLNLCAGIAAAIFALTFRLIRLIQDPTMIEVSAARAHRRIHAPREAGDRCLPT